MKTIPTTRLRDTLTSEDWATVRDEALHFQGTLLWRVMEDKYQRQTSLHMRELLDKASPEATIRNAQGYISAMRYAIMLVEEIVKDATAGRLRETNKENANG